jgi:hypothetical protein
MDIYEAKRFERPCARLQTVVEIPELREHG